MTTTIEACKEEVIQCFSNVSHFRNLEHKEPQEFVWEITYDEKTLPKDTSVPIYFILDSFNHDAFSHWVYENAVWLGAFVQLQKAYPSMRIVIQKWKESKKLYFNYYNIPLDRVCLQSEMEPKNYCFFHTYTSFNDKQIPSIYFHNLMNYKTKIDSLDVTKKIPLLYLPRGTKENLLGFNNRMYNVQDDLKLFVKQLGGTVYETDSTKNLNDQIQIVKESSIILLDYGSNLWVNGVFAENSHIICLNIGWHQHPQYPSMGALWDLIHRKNTLNQIFAYTAEKNNGSDIPVVSFHMPAIVQEIMAALSKLQ
jgi:hypothetical protein